MKGGTVRSALTRGAIAVTIACTLAGCGPVGHGGGSPAAQGTSSAEALRTLKTLQVKGRAPMTGFDRQRFGPAWADVDHNGCDTRNDVLKRDLKGETFKRGTHDCVVLTGILDDPYKIGRAHV